MKREKEVVKISGGDAWFIGVSMLFIAFFGEPDLIDALIHFLMKGD